MGSTCERALSQVERIYSGIRGHLYNVHWHPIAADLDQMLADIGPFTSLDDMRLRGATWLKAAQKQVRILFNQTVPPVLFLFVPGLKLHAGWMRHISWS